MMKKLLTALLLLAACSKEPVVQAPTDTREPVETAYVSAPELKVYARPDESSPVIIKYENNESVSVLARQGQWTEIRTGDGSGWARSADLGSASDAQQQEENPQVRFQRSPAGVMNISAKGEVYIEADVNTDGDVVATRILTNTTGSPELALQNEAALRTAKFYPMVVKGERRPFKYYHRVTY